MRRFIYTVIVLFIAAVSAFAKVNIAPGKWQAVRSYGSISKIVPSKEKVYVVAGGGLFSYDKKSKEAIPLSTLDGLSPSAIEMVEYVESTRTLFVIHSDMTIDLMVDGIIFSDESIRESEISGKKVNNLKVDGDKVYISLDAGIVVYNTRKREVVDTYIIGDGGEYEIVYQTVALNGNLYSLINNTSTCSRRKLKVCDEGENANDYSVWKPIELPVSCSDDTIVVKKMDCASGHVVVLTNRGLFSRLENGDWVDISPTGIVPDTFFVNRDRLTAITDSQIMVFHNDNFVDLKYRECWSKIAVYDVDEDAVWLDFGQGLRMADLSNDKVKPSLSERINISGPSQNGFYSVQVIDGDVYLTGNHGYDVPAVADYCQDDTWHYLRDAVIRDTTIKKSSKYSFNGAYRMLVDPHDKNHIYVPTWWGLHEFYKDSLVAIHDKSNTAFQGALTSSRCTIVECGWYDDDHNLFATNPNSHGSLVYVMDTTGEWKDLGHREFLNQGSGHFHLRTSSGIDFITAEYSDCSIAILDMNKTPFDPSDDKTKVINTFKYAEDGMMESLVPTYIFGVEEDFNGDVWIATDQGPLIMKNVKGVFEDKETYVRPKITREDDSRYADYLLASDKVRKIQVDGKNRKWIATEGNGVFLVSSSGDKIIENFTVKNSPLSSNTIMDIVYEKETGVLYILTDVGLLMYATDSSYPMKDFNDAIIYPNPVRSYYDGDVEIKGLMEDSNVRITDQRGAVIENGISNGGTYRFSARRSDGSRLPTGVYNVFVTTSPDENGVTETKHMKFAIIR